MNDRAAGEVENAHFTQPAADAPYPVGNRIIDQRGPDHGENCKRGKLHPFGKRAGD